ncbi:hypothetical protein [Sporosarcina sp. YIM B06819]|uniref:hypothetical protein n=1 Tax=Sporosarcina sp. YIM B06819 TaxID=3081769 RepID=UPI00298C399B|nr:hypothetical protein [Sporosarcina sp. YIM B06819]
MEELILYVPNLEQQFYKRKELQYNITQLPSSVTGSMSHVNYVKEERKLYFNAVTFGTLEFQVMLLDFEQNKITFKGKKDPSGNINERLYELLTSLKLDFQPIQMSFMMNRPIKQN